MRTQLLQLPAMAGLDHSPWLFRMLAIQIYTVDDRGIVLIKRPSSTIWIVFLSLSQTWLESVLVGCVSSWNSRAKSANLFEVLMIR